MKKKTDLEQVKKLASRLSPQDRVQLFAFLAKLPDSLITTLPIPQTKLEKPEPEEQDTLRLECKQEGNLVVCFLEGVEVFRMMFHAEKYVEVLYKTQDTERVFLHLTDEQRDQIKEGLQEKSKELGITLTDEEMIAIEPLGLRMIGQKLIRDSFQHSANLLNENLPRVAGMILQRIVPANMLAAANQLRDLLEVPEQKRTAKQIKDSLYNPEWEVIKPLAGVKHGGERKRKRSAFTWDKDKAKEFFKAVQALPRISKKPLWDYAAEQLHENDYATEIVTWLQSNPAFIDSPQRLLKDAASVWRTYAEESKNVPAESKPLAFAFRHACYKLGYFAGKYNTLRTRYYEGKKAQELIDKP
jgi:hypothetical protein